MFSSFMIFQHDTPRALGFAQRIRPASTNCLGFAGASPLISRWMRTSVASKRLLRRCSSDLMKSSNFRCLNRWGEYKLMRYIYIYISVCVRLYNYIYMCVYIICTVLYTSDEFSSVCLSVYVVEWNGMEWNEME